jgi:hypothetical protein
VAEEVKMNVDRHVFAVTETRRLNRNGRPFGFRQTTRRELQPWELWALNILSRCNDGNRKAALLSLISILVQETCETMLKAGIDGPKVTDIRFKLCRELKDELLSKLGATATSTATREDQPQ